MPLTPWLHENPFVPGTTVRAAGVNAKLDGIAQAIEAICQQVNEKVPNLPAAFTGAAQIPEKTLPNTLLFINSAGAMDLYPKAQFDADVAEAADAAAAAATSANNAQTSANQASTYRNSAQGYAEDAEASAEAAQNSAVAANQAKNDTMSALDTRLGTTGNLGDAAQKTVTTSPTDTIAGRLLKVGDFGLGATTGTTQIPPDTTRRGSGFYYYSSADSIVSGVPLPVVRSNAPVAGRAWELGCSVGADEWYGRTQKTTDTWSAPVRFYYDKNILGTVAQSGGVPTGAIIQRGSNANGEFVRFADGTQICTHSVLFDFATINRVTLAYPIAFIVSPVSYACGAFTTTGAIQDLYNNIICMYSLGSWELVNRTTGVYTPTIRVCAIGRWF